MLSENTSTNWRRKGGDSFVVFYQYPLPTPSPSQAFPFFFFFFFFLIFPQDLQWPRRGCVLAWGPSNSCWHQGTVLWQLLDCFPPLFLGLTFLSITHQYKKPPDCLQVVGKLHLGIFRCLPKTWEEAPDSHLGRGFLWGGGGGRRCSCSLRCHSCSWVDSRCVCLRTVFSVYLLSRRLPFCQCLTKSACHYFVFWNPKC